MSRPSPDRLFALARRELDRRDATGSQTARLRHTASAMFFAGEAWRMIVQRVADTRTVH